MNWVQNHYWTLIHTNWNRGLDFMILASLTVNHA